MLKGCGFRVILLPAALLAQILFLVGTAIILRAGTGSLDNSSHLPATPNLYIVLINTDGYTSEVAGDEYHGLPDSHDYQKEKDFFALFPALYCSGKKVDGYYEADYCSLWAKQLFDLQGLWRVWGVDLYKDNLIGSTPKLIMAGLLTTAAADTVSAVLTIFAICSYWCAIVGVVFAWICVISAIATAALSQVFVDRLIKYDGEADTSGTGEIHAERGVIYIRTAWIGCGIALIVAILLLIVVVKLHKARSKARRGAASQFPPRSFISSKFAGKNASYKHVDQEMVRLNSREPSPDPFSRSMKQGSISRGLSPEADESKGGVLSRDSAYEPMRHRSVE